MSFSQLLTPISSLLTPNSPNPLSPQKGGPLIDTKQFQRRGLAVVGLMALLLTGLGLVFGLLFILLH